MTEFVSVAAHARRFDSIALSKRDRIVVWDLAPLAFVQVHYNLKSQVLMPPLLQ